MVLLVDDFHGRQSAAAATANTGRGDRLRVGIICDFVEEGWESMDLTADMLLDRFQEDFQDRVDAIRFRPEMRRRGTRIKGGSTYSPAASRLERVLFNVDRLANRFWDYPRFLRASQGVCDVFHVVDHSYAQLVHVLPVDRTVVTCHDLEAFRPVVDVRHRAKSGVHRIMAERVLSGFRRAAHVVCVSKTVYDELIEYDLVPRGRLSVIRNGVHPACKPDSQPGPDEQAARLLGPQLRDVPELLHVGSTIPRKGIGVLLQVFERVRRQIPQAQLIRVGGAFTPAQARLAQELGVANAVRVLPRLDRETLAAVYRRAALVLQPSEAEGFGLPVAEAMACGAAVVASDLPVLREVGSYPTAYCPVADVPAWADTVLRLLRQRVHDPIAWEVRRAASLRTAQRYSWYENALCTLAVYQRVARAD